MQAREWVPEGMAPRFLEIRRQRQWPEWLGILGLAATGIALWLSLAAGLVAPLGEALARLDAAAVPAPAREPPLDGALAAGEQTCACPGP